MFIITQNHTYKYESEKICRIFFPSEKIVFADAADSLTPADRTIVTRVEPAENGLRFSCEAFLDGRTASSTRTAAPSDVPDDAAGEKLLARVMADVLTRLTGIVPPWGILTGVRPSKLMRTCVDLYGRDGAEEKFRTFFGVSPEKTALALDIDARQRHIVNAVRPADYSLYISIPFCPTRCSYCSFVSHSIAQAKKLVPDYVRLLREEISVTAKIAAEAGLRLQTVYVGGGTPTSLSAEALETVLEALNTCLNARQAAEFTVEAGRPDTITREKLCVLKNAGVTRISINPQTFSDCVLQAIGRRHTAQETVEKFRLARQLGFDNINMDLIAGLPTDTYAGFCESLENACGLDPENITVHTLALKRAASLVTGDAAATTAAAGETARMVDFSHRHLYENGYVPYYMYRQSKSADNLENVGWAKPARVCLYNVYMMEELHTVLACGGGAVTKLVTPGDRDIKRVYNFKYPYEYISRFDELIDRKEEIKEFYGK